MTKLTESFLQELEEAFEYACGNSAISQWIAMNAKLTVIEELQAQRIAA